MFRFIILVMLALVAFADRAAAQDKFEVRGFVKQVDAKLGTITIDITKSGPQTYSLAKPDIPIRDAREKPLKLDNVQPGRKVSLDIVSAADVASIKIFPSFKVGKVVSVNAETRELVLLVKKENLRFMIAKDAHYYRSDRVVAPLELRAGERITAYYIPESNEVITINYKNLDGGS